MSLFPLSYAVLHRAKRHWCHHRQRRKIEQANIDAVSMYRYFKQARHDRMFCRMFRVN